MLWRFGFGVGRPVVPTDRGRRELVNVSITASHRRRRATSNEPEDARSAVLVLMVWAALIVAAGVLLISL